VADNPGIRARRATAGAVGLLALGLSGWGCDPSTDARAPASAPSGAAGARAGAAPEAGGGATAGSTSTAGPAPGVAGAALELPSCLTPSAPVLAGLHPGAVLAFSVPSDPPLQVGTALEPTATEPEEWLDGGTVTLPDAGALTVFARVADPACDAGWFSHRYAVVAAYPGPAGSADSTAIAQDDPRITGWAAAVEALELGAGSDDPDLRDPARALGPAEGTATDAVSLGEGGTITLRFDPPLADGDGVDLAVFENGFSADFLELAWVEVSSDGAHFVRFDSAFLGADPIDPFGTLDTTLFDGLAGKYEQGHGTPFDLAWLRHRPETAVGILDLDQVAWVRVVDVVGDGSSEDSFGHPIYDPYPTAQTAGFDLDAVAALHGTSP